jgi:hypothetical protein
MEMGLCATVRDDCDELIVCEDGPYIEALREACDLYICHGQRLGHPSNLWQGILRAHCDYVGVLDWDVEIKKGSLRDLCFPGHFVSAKLLPAPDHRTGFIIWCSVMDRQTLLKFPMPQSGELLDDWADTIPRHLRMNSDAVEYEHHTGIGVSEWNRVHGL